MSLVSFNHNLPTINVWVLNDPCIYSLYSSSFCKTSLITMLLASGMSLLQTHLFVTVHKVGYKSGREDIKISLKSQQPVKNAKEANLTGRSSAEPGMREMRVYKSHWNSSTAEDPSIYIGACGWKSVTFTWFSSTAAPTAN